MAFTRATMGLNGASMNYAAPGLVTYATLDTLATVQTAGYFNAAVSSDTRYIIVGTQLNVSASDGFSIFIISANNYGTWTLENLFGGTGDGNVIADGNGVTGDFPCYSTDGYHLKNSALSQDVSGNLYASAGLNVTGDVTCNYLYGANQKVFTFTSTGTITQAEANLILVITSGSNLNYALADITSFLIGFNVTIVQGGAGVITLVPHASDPISSLTGSFSTAGIGSRVTLSVVAFTAFTPRWLVSGDVGGEAAGGNVIADGSGTTGIIPKYTSDGYHIGNSSIIDASGLVTINNPTSISGDLFLSNNIFFSFSPQNNSLLGYDRDGKISDLITNTPGTGLSIYQGVLSLQHGYIQFTGNVTLDANAINAIVTYTGTTAATLTLPLSNTVPNNAVIELKMLTATGTINVAVQGSDTLVTSGSTLLSAYQYAKFVNSGGTWLMAVLSTGDNLDPVIRSSSSVTPVAINNNTFYMMSSSSNIGVSLPLIATVPIGWTIEVMNLSFSANVTVSTSDASQMNFLSSGGGPTNAASLTIKTFGTVKIKRGGQVATPVSTPWQVWGDIV